MSDNELFLLFEISSEEFYQDDYLLMEDIYHFEKD